MAYRLAATRSMRASWDWHLDYDRTDVPAVYDRGRSHGPNVLDLWMDNVASHVRGRRILNILDLGCGTGRSSDALAKCFEADVVGVDPSKKMLAEARCKPHSRCVRYARARGEAVPLADRSADLVFMSMVFHHFDDPRLVARECYRVLHDEGVVFLRAGTLAQMPADT